MIAKFEPGNSPLDPLHPGYARRLAGAELFKSDDPAFDLATGDFSVAVWVNTSIGQTTRTQVIAEKRDIGGLGAAAGWRFVFGGGGTSWGNTWVSDAAGNYVRIAPGESFTWDDGWHFLVLTWDQSEQDLRLYLDGVDQSCSLTKSGTVGAVSSGSPFTIGAAWIDAMTQDRHFEGDLSKIVLASHVLSQGEIDYLFNDGKGRVANQLGYLGDGEDLDDGLAYDLDEKGGAATAAVGGIDLEAIGIIPGVE